MVKGFQAEKSTRNAIQKGGLSKCFGENTNPVLLTTAGAPGILWRGNRGGIEQIFL